MKKVFAIVVLVVAMVINGYGQFSFSVAPGIGTNSAYFGYKLEKAVPYAGVQLLNGNFKLNMTDKLVSGSILDESTTRANVNLFVPTIGVKYFAFETGDLKAYFNLSANKPMISGKAKHDDTEIEEISEVLKKVKMYGAELGFGAEYFLSNNFSVGGEFSIRYMGGNYTREDEYDHSEGDALEIYKYSLGLVPTIAKFTLNYYFGGGNN